MIIFLHYSELFLGKAVCIGGYVCVEMFFIISGYLMCTGLERLQADRPVGVNAAEFIAKKIKHLYPYVLAAFCVYYIPLCSQAVRVPDEMENQIWGLLLLSQTGLGGGGALGHTWYLSVMLLGMTILAPVMLLDKKNKIMFVYAPVAASFCYAFLKARYGTLQAEVYFLAADGIGIRPNLLRGTGGLCIGIFLYFLSESFQKMKLEKLKNSKWIFRSAKLLEMFLCIICYGIIMQKQAFNYWDFITVLLFMPIVFCAVAFEYKIKNENVHKVTEYLGKLSLPLYLFQNTPAYIVRKMEPKAYGYQMKTLVFLSVLIILSVASVYFFEKLLPRLKVHVSKVWKDV